MKCPNCLRMLDPNATWKSKSHFYCSEFCADAEPTELAAIPSSLLEYHRNYTERLERLMHLRRAA
jgi:hypothetical protein